jgi:hypothetical protein
LVDELRQQGITHVYLDGDNEMIDILRVTCIEGGIAVSDMPVEVTLRAAGNDFKMVISKKPN